MISVVTYQQFPLGFHGAPRAAAWIGAPKAGIGFFLSAMIRSRMRIVGGSGRGILLHSPTRTGKTSLNNATTKRPHCIVIAGPNGAGKTTFAREFLYRPLADAWAVYDNSGEVPRLLEEGP